VYVPRRALATGDTRPSLQKGAFWDKLAAPWHFFLDPTARIRGERERAFSFLFFFY
jgi:hypothetical protein